MIRRTLEMLNTLGFNPLQSARVAALTPRFVADYVRFRQQQRTSESALPFGKLYPCLLDKYDSSGAATGQYFHQDLLVAQRIFAAAPQLHADVGSRIDGFVAHVASFRPIVVFDIRAQPSKVHNIEFHVADFMGTVPERFHEFCDSLSCLHALEHFGLGRYGDPICVDGFIRGFENLLKVLKTDGTLYLSVPIGPPRIEFNAHRIFSVSHLYELFANRARVRRISYVDDRGDLHDGVDGSDEAIATNFGCNNGCGIFELVKLP
jgi:hypothetical protein